MIRKQNGSALPLTILTGRLNHASNEFFDRIHVISSNEESQPEFLYINGFYAREFANNQLVLVCRDNFGLMCLKILMSTRVYRFLQIEIAKPTSVEFSQELDPVKARYQFIGQVSSGDISIIVIKFPTCFNSDENQYAVCTRFLRRYKLVQYLPYKLRVALKHGTSTVALR